MPDRVVAGRVGLFDTLVFVGVGERPAKLFDTSADTFVLVAVAVEKSNANPPPKAGMPGVGDSVSAADVAVRKDAPAVWLTSAKTVSIKGVAGVAEGVVEGVNVLEGVNARMVAVAALGVLVRVAVTVVVGSVPVTVTVTDGEGVTDKVTVGRKVAEGGIFVNAG